MYMLRRQIYINIQKFSSMNPSQRSMKETSRVTRNQIGNLKDIFISKYTKQLQQLDEQQHSYQNSLNEIENNRGYKYRMKEEKKKQKESAGKNKYQEYIYEEEQKEQSNQIEDKEERIQNFAQNLALVIKKNQKQFTLWKRKQTLFNSSIHYDLKNKIQNKQLSQQPIKKNTELQAYLYAQIIHKIAEYPTIESLREQSLVDQIYKILVKYQQNRKQDISHVKQQLDKLFVQGVQLNTIVFNQQRIKQAEKQNKIPFHPTCVVTGQIFRQLVLKKDFKFCISYGHKGIAKTFSYFFYQMLSNLFLKEIVQKQLDILGNLCRKFKIYTIPKLFYWNMNIYYNTSSMDIKKIFFQQCKEIPRTKMIQIERICQIQKNNSQHLFKFLKQICDFYKQLSIETYLIIDQINQIASAFREHYIMKKKKQFNQTIQKRHKLAEKLNGRRILITDASIFNCVIYNSSVNNEILFNQNNFSFQENQELYENIKKSLHLVPQQQHSQSQCYQFRILYPEIIKLQSTAWSIADMIMFELKKYIYLEENVIKKLRKKIFDLVVLDQGKTIFSNLSIRQEINEHKKTLLISQQYQKQIKQIIEEIKINQKEQLKLNYKKFQQKILVKKQRLKVKAILLNFYLQKREQKTNKKYENNFLNKIMNQEAKSTMIQLFSNNINLKTKKNFIFQHLDRNLFISFKKRVQLENYLIQLLAYLKSEFQNNLLQNQYKQQRNLIHHFIKKSNNEFFSNGEINSIGFSLFPSDQIIELIKQQISQFYELEIQEMKEILNLFCPKTSRIAYGIFLEKNFIDYLKQVQIKLNQSLSFKNKNPKESIQMKVLPRLFRNQNCPLPKYKNLEHIKKQNKIFLSQFLVFDSGCYLYQPISKTSKAIDFALLKSKINDKIVCYKIHLFEVTLRTVKQQLQNKINLFLEAEQLLEQELKQMDEILEIKKKSLQEKKEFIFQIYYWVMGDSLNFKKIQSLTCIANEKIKKRENSYLKNIIPLNFSKLEIKMKNQSKYVGNLLCILQEKLKNTTQVQ